MPLGRPTDDGEIVHGSRKYRGRESLGVQGVWQCPACGRKVEGRAIEQGCPHCGAGDPAKSTAGQAEQVTGGRTDRQAPPSRTVVLAATGEGGEPARRPPVAPAQPLRVLRLIEYLIHPGQNADVVLRRSLVGTMHMAWGQLTGTIVDSCDVSQEDRLRLAKLQPGVWLANDSAMQEADNPLLQLHPDGVVRPVFARHTSRYTGPKGPEFSIRKEPAPHMAAPPDTGPHYTDYQHNIALAIVEMGGYQLANTLALALSSIAQELEGNSEPEKFLSSEECLQVANALIQQIPSTWTGATTDTPPPPLSPEDEARVKGDLARRRDIQERMAEAARPTPVFREPDEPGNEEG